MDYQSFPMVHIQWPNLDFMMMQPVLLIIYDFPRVSYTRIYHFLKCFNRELFCYGPIYVQCQQEEDLTSNFWANWGFLMSQPILVVIFNFPKAYYTRIYRFQKCFNWKKICQEPIYVQWQKEVDLTSNFLIMLEFFDVVVCFAYHTRLPQGFLHQNLLFSRKVQLGIFLLLTDLCTVPIGGRPHIEFFHQI